jgi:single-strand selective monofunctional uracil DNA glycosylase
MEQTGRNRTPDKLRAREKELLFAACDRHLLKAVQVLQPEWVIGVGDFARRRAEAVFPGGPPRIGQILHPSPASPAANRSWSKAVTGQLVKLGVWQNR